ncbi:hypothetical protein DRW03_14945 [Corallococcus sp. H22C18031201]|uniref:hypothetical protein n=1 Tax=Citreicoccus inhibens TaxID=2849499 RepID=UPI000E729717|nr:hypothetical protein [Citreicoccus inhibens]MBU8895358.1 hypothetical protein [Citreicoccus inhibens]RJS22599.1 hypothetical protein DRW03_14945 [Corallococcus sp. H22C18031201]
MTTHGASQVSKTSTPHDWFLELLLNMVNDHGLNVGITLTVGGTQVSGELVSGAEFIKNFGSTFSGALKRAGAGDAAASLQAKYETMAAQVYDAKKAESAHEPLTFIHLRDARIVGPNGVLQPPQIWWRGRLSEVQGWSLGVLNKE